jgi:hypothetical protein
MTGFHHTTQDYQRGQADAQRDIAAGKLIIRMCGRPAPYVFHWLRILKNRYDIQLINSGCRVSDELLAYISGYNNVSQAEIQQRFGVEVLEQTRQAAQATQVAMDENTSQHWAIRYWLEGKWQWLSAIVCPFVATYISTWVNLVAMVKPISLILNALCFLVFLWGLASIGLMPYSKQNRISLYGLYVPLLLIILPSVILWVVCNHSPNGFCL